MRRLPLLIALAACGDNATDPGVHGGKRLRIVEYVYDDGSRHTDPRVLFDTKLRERCVATQFSDGARYCMPESAGDNTVFVDATCTSVLGITKVDTPAPPYFIRKYMLHGEARPSRIYRAGTETRPPAQIWTQQDGYCLGPVATPPGSFFRVGEEINPADLVRLRETSVRAGDALTAGVDTSTDGLLTFGAIYDVGTNKPCSMNPSANAAVAECVPRELPAASFYADASCTTPLLAVAGDAPAQLATFHAVDTGCWGLVRVGAALPASSIFAQIGTSCVAVPPPSDATLYATDSPSPLAAFTRVTDSKASGRVRGIDLVEGALHIGAPEAFDAELGADCAVVADDGDYACVPSAAVATYTVFGDAQCTTPLDLAFVPTGGCFAPAMFAARGDERLPIGEVFTQPFYELEPGDRCGTFEAPRGTVAHAVGAAVPRSAFAHARMDVQR